jgi:hypothetical protein
MEVVSLPLFVGSRGKVMNVIPLLFFIGGSNEEFSVVLLFLLVSSSGKEFGVVRSWLVSCSLKVFDVVFLLFLVGSSIKMIVIHLVALLGTHLVVESSIKLVEASTVYGEAPIVCGHSFVLVIVTLVERNDFVVLVLIFRLTMGAFVFSSMLIGLKLMMVSVVIPLLLLLMVVFIMLSFKMTTILLLTVCQLIGSVLAILFYVGHLFIIL